MTVLQTAGLSHSEIRGSKVICTYPQLIAAYHVLHRLREPRHPPCALARFISALHNTLKDQPAKAGKPTKHGRHILLAVKIVLLLIQSTYSLACVNMSKNDSIGYPEHTNRRKNRGNAKNRNTDGQVENNGFEPLTPCLQSRCSSQLS